MSDWYVNVNTHRCFIMSMMYARNLVDLHLKYYTDDHNVDEDMTTIVHVGGKWWDGIGAGIIHRDFFHSSSISLDSVASKYNKNSTLITGVEF